MVQPFSLDDLFAVGVGLDLAGAFLLGRGLIVSPEEIVRRSQMRLEFHPVVAVGQVRDRVDALGGLVVLGGGFTLQALGYVLSLVDIGGGHGWLAALLAAVLAVTSGSVAYLGFARLFRTRLLKRALVELACFDTAGRWHELPSSDLLRLLGQELGHYSLEHEVLPGGSRDYARRVASIASAPTPASDGSRDSTRST